VVVGNVCGRLPEMAPGGKKWAEGKLSPLVRIGGAGQPSRKGGPRVRNRFCKLRDQKNGSLAGETEVQSLQKGGKNGNDGKKTARGGKNPTKHDY